MALDPQILEVFIMQMLTKPHVAELTASWRIDPKRIEEALANSMREMGINSVPKGHEDLITKAIIAQLKHSPEIMQMVRKANRAHAMKNTSRHKE